jgi:hypothetical protein
VGCLCPVLLPAAGDGMTPQWDWQIAAVALAVVLIAVVTGRLL